MRFSLPIILFLLDQAWSAAPGNQSVNFKPDTAHQIMRTRVCGVCHIPPGNPIALKIFDLDENQWSLKMTDDQLAQIKWRIKVKGPEIKEMRGDPKIHEFTEKEIKLVSEYVDRELFNRKLMIP